MNMKKEPKWTFSKKAVVGLLIIGAINGTLPFLLSYLDKDPVTQIGVAWITEIVAVILGYLLKSYKENKQKGIQNHSDFEAGMFDDQTNPKWQQNLKDSESSTSSFEWQGDVEENLEDPEV